jgi:hypothetical protein
MILASSYNWPSSRSAPALTNYEGQRRTKRAVLRANRSLSACPSASQPAMVPIGRLAGADRLSLVAAALVAQRHAHHRSRCEAANAGKRRA